MTPIETVFITTAVGVSSGVVGKIVWDWMATGRKSYDPEGVGRKCLDHNACVISLDQIKRDQAVQSATVKQNNDSIALRLAKGDARMDKMADDIAEIKTGVAVLVSRMSERSERPG